MMCVSPWAFSSVAASLISIPAFAAMLEPTMIAVGVAKPNAQGHAITKVAAALLNACSRPAP